MRRPRGASAASSGRAPATAIDGISKSLVSDMARSLDTQVEASAPGPSTPGLGTYVAVDAQAPAGPRGGRIVNVACATATGVNADRHREILGVDVFTTEQGQARRHSCQAWSHEA